MRRCWGRTKNLTRCTREGAWRLFCHDHKYQWLLILSFFITVGGSAASIVGYYQINNPSVYAEQESELERFGKSAFKAGHSYSKIVSTEDHLERAVWVNRFTARLKELRISDAFIEKYFSDNYISSQEMILLHDEVKVDIEYNFGREVSDTFIFATELESIVDTYTKYLSDENFRDELHKKKGDATEYIRRIGMPINTTIDGSIFPKKYKENWSVLYANTMFLQAYPSQLESLKAFKNNIVNYFYN